MCKLKIVTQCGISGRYAQGHSDAVLTEATQEIKPSPYSAIIAPSTLTHNPVSNTGLGSTCVTPHMVRSKIDTTRSSMRRVTQAATFREARVTESDFTEEVLGMSEG
ncbi:hypothetical protein E2C01_009127 [Portunus trituberculatus]|uniref:Uncharacterized protein n=1 Tax=Portunus trituberculatus TaxID=210409 RepID=A0A5B7D5B2_PORTR|nr:hypothetical protein [Portunus trituberculatus]